MDSVKKLESVLGALDRIRDDLVNEIIKVKPFRLRVYEKEVEVPAGKSVNIEFGVDFVLPQTIVLGLPETAETHFGVEFDFIIRHLIINSEDAPYFDVNHFFYGTKILWNHQKKVAAIKFVDESVCIDKTVERGNTITVTVTNTSDVPRKIRAKIVGEEQVIR